MTFGTHPVWYVVVCIEIYSSKVFDPKGSSTYTTLSCLRHINTQYRDVILLDQKLQYQMFLYI